MTQALVPRAERIIGPPDQVERSLETLLRRGLLLTPPDQVGLRWRSDGTVEVRVTILAEPAAPEPPSAPAPAPAPARRADPVFAEIGKALAWALGLLALGAGAVWTLIAILGAPVLVLLLAGLLVMAFMGNRGRHRGACPGFVVHCKGCRDH